LIILLNKKLSLGSAAILAVWYFRSAALCKYTMIRAQAQFAVFIRLKCYRSGMIASNENVTGGKHVH